MITNDIDAKKEIENNILMRLGGGMIDVELEPQQLEFCVNLALRKLKQKSDAVLEESLILMTIEKNQKEYILPAEVVDVMKLYRQGFGRGCYSGTNLDLFSYSAFTNIYMCGLQGSSKVGGLVTYDQTTSYMLTAGKMFGMYMNFWFNPNTHKLVLQENPRTDSEIIAIHAFNMKPDYMILQDQFSGLWCENWALAEAKQILGEERERFGSLPGPNGQGIQQNGQQLKSESKAEKEALEKELANFVAGGNQISPMRVYSG